MQRLHDPAVTLQLLNIIVQDNKWLRWLAVTSWGILPLVALVSSGRANDIRALIILVVATAISYAYFRLKPSKTTLLGQPLLAIYVVGLLLSFVLHPHISELVGSFPERLGVLELLGIILICGCVSRLKQLQLKNILIIVCSLTSFVNIIYSVLGHHLFEGRLAGIDNHPLMVAVVAGVGFVAALDRLFRVKRYRYLTALACLLCLTTALLTQTRAVIAMLVVIQIIYAWHSWKVRSERMPRLALLIACIVLVSLVSQFSTTKRLTDANYAGASVEYRYELQKIAVRQIFHHPFGVGLTGLPEVFHCNYELPTALAETCSEGILLKSSHNVFLDRILELGWIPGLALIILTLRSFINGFFIRRENIMWASILLLVVTYYLTNIPSLISESIYWLALLPLAESRHHKKTG